jgi:hypothetical protein
MAKDRLIDGSAEREQSPEFLEIWNFPSRIPRRRATGRLLDRETFSRLLGGMEPNAIIRYSNVGFLLTLP